MVYIEINRKNYQSGSPNLIDKLNQHLTRKDDKIFIFYFMEGCGPCNATRPEWSKLKNVLSNDFKNREDIVIVSIDKDLAGKLKNIGEEPNSFPTIRFMKDAGRINENYEDSDISNKDRSIDSFVQWIKLKSGENNITKSENQQRKSHKRGNLKLRGGTRRKRGGKWSLKYKRSINCKTPRGFSQKQYCKYGRK
jgi:thiol-disulfide isomerase/thioredoxin